jgi:hypothetical protein
MAEENTLETCRRNLAAAYTRLTNFETKLSKYAASDDLFLLKTELSEIKNLFNTHLKELATI